MNPPRRPEDSPNWGGKRDKQPGRPKKGAERRKMTAFSVPPSLVEWLDVEAAAGEVSRSDVVVRILEAARAGRPGGSERGGVGDTDVIKVPVEDWLETYAAQRELAPAAALDSILSRFSRALQKASKPRAIATSQPIRLDLPDDAWAAIAWAIEATGVSRSDAAARLMLAGAAVLGADQQ